MFHHDRCLHLFHTHYSEHSHNTDNDQERGIQNSNILIAFLYQHVGVTAKGHLRKSTVSKVRLHEHKGELAYTHHRIHVVQLVELAHLPYNVTVIVNRREMLHNKS